MRIKTAGPSCLVIGVLLFALTGCVSRPINRPDWARFGNTSSADGGVAYHRDPHHQYLDKIHNRYYYYDPVQKRFFWENGAPKI